VKGGSAETFERHPFWITLSIIDDIEEVNLKG
jgi:hypothetical protein